MKPLDPTEPTIEYEDEDEHESVLPAYVAVVAPVRTRGYRIGVLAGVIALVAGLGFAAAQIKGAAGGADSPDAAVRELLQSFGDGDVIGVFEAMPDGERQVIKEPAQDVAGELKRLGILKSGFSLSDVGGYHLTFKDLHVETTVLGDGVASVQLTGGTIISEVRPDTLPFGQTVKDAAKQLDANLDDIKAVRQEQPISRDDNVRIVAIKDGGRWYASLFYTAAEYLRASGDLAAPDFGHGVPAKGADNPEAAVSEMFKAALDLDARRAIELLPPKEMRVVHDYAPLFLPDVESAAADAKADLSLTHLKLSSETAGDHASVHIEELTVEGTVDGEQGKAVWDGTCFSFTSSNPDNDQKSCVGDKGPLSGVDPSKLLSLTAVREDGKWYISPIRSVLDQAVQALKATSKADVKKLIDSLNDGSFVFPYFGSSSQKFTAVGGEIGTDPKFDPLFAALRTTYDDGVALCIASFSSVQLDQSQIDELIAHLEHGAPLATDLETLFNEGIADCDVPTDGTGPP